MKSLDFKTIILPFLLFMLFMCFYFLWPGEPLLRNLLDLRWDGFMYRQIALFGYGSHICEGCGLGDSFYSNHGWFPLWPLINRWFAASFLGGNVILSFQILGIFFTVLSVYLFHFYTLKQFNSKSAFWSTLAFLLVPAGFFMVTAYPYALILSLMLTYAHIFHTKDSPLKYIGCGLLGLALSLSYPSACFFVLVPISSILLSKTLSVSNRIKKCIIFGTPFVLGPLLLSLYFLIEHNNFWMILDFQKRYNRTFISSFTQIHELIKQLTIKSPSTHTLLWYGLVLFVFRKSIHVLPKPLFIFTLVILCFSPASGSFEAIYRHYLLAFPISILIGVASQSAWIKTSVILVGALISFYSLYYGYMTGYLV
jgi:hypothetical protein